MTMAVDALFVVTVVGLAVPVARRLPDRARVVLIAWLLALGVLAAGGAFLRDGRMPAYFAGVGLLPSAAGVAFVCSRAGTAVLAHTSPAALVGWQSFRVVVEIALWALALAVVWNVAGIAILANIVAHALVSAPTPFQALRLEPPTTVIATVPYIWLPGFLVPLALSLHLASLRTLGVGPAPVKET